MPGEVERRFHSDCACVDGITDTINIVIGQSWFYIHFLSHYIGRDVLLFRTDLFVIVLLPSVHWFDIFAICLEFVLWKETCWVSQF